MGTSLYAPTHILQKIVLSTRLGSGLIIHFNCIISKYCKERSPPKSSRDDWGFEDLMDSLNCTVEETYPCERTNNGKPERTVQTIERFSEKKEI